MRTCRVVALGLLCVGGANAGSWPLRRAARERKQEEPPSESELSRQRLRTYETALRVQHLKLQELSLRNYELERALSYTLNVFVVSIVWPRISRLVAALVKRGLRPSHAHRTTFSDVAGSVEAKRELQEVVEFLRHPKKFKQVGARVPKGVLMEGAPGVGKTLLARAVAGEAGVSFLDTSGAALGSTIYVGVGASKVRALFAEARRKRPCIVFIDEIDALGGRRDSSPGGAESSRTLNQLLTEMDGFEGDTGVVVIGATNRADVLDPALLRAGRFDRRVPIDPPNVEERVDILRVHAKGKELSADVDLASLARRTSGFSGAELATLLNEAAIATACRNGSVIKLADVDAALEKQQIGLRRPSHMAARVRATIAVHEAGHACVALLTRYDKVAKVTILPRSSGVGGFTAFANADETDDGDECASLPTRERLLKRLQVLLAGRVAEEIAFGHQRVTVGASDDLRRAHALARDMVTRYGMAGNDLGLTAPEGLAGPRGGGGLPEVVARRVSRSVDLLLSSSYSECRRTMRANWKLVDAMRAALLDKETLSAAEVDVLFAAHPPVSAYFWARLWARLPTLPAMPQLPAPADAPAIAEPRPALEPRAPNQPVPAPA